LLNRDRMAREGWEHGKIEEKPEKAREGGKTVRFVNSETCDKNERTPVEPTPQNPVSMVQSLVPHLPGLDKDTIYVISGPFPNYDPVSGPSQLLMATPISPGATVVAVPLGPPPPGPNRQPPAGQHMPHPGNPGQVNQPNNNQTQTGKTRREQRPQQPMPTMYQPQPPVQHPMPHGAQRPSPLPPHMLHWDTFHPVGQTIPLRQPNPPVYYNVPSPNSSGLQSPGSDGSSMSCSDISEDQEEANNHGHMVHGQNVCYFQPNPNMTHMMGYPPHLRNFQGPPQFCNLNQQQGQVFAQQGHGGQNFNQAYISS